jgi:hypothetical protein
MRSAILVRAGFTTEEVGASSSAREGDPLLFRTFAEVAPEEAAIEAFASQHGNLLHPDGPLSPVRRGGAKEPDVVAGVSLDLWVGQITEMRRLTELWDLIQQEDEKALAQHICWGEETLDEPAIYCDGELIDSVVSWTQPLANLRPGDVIGPAKAHLQVQLDLHLHHASDDVKVGMTWDYRRQHPVVAYWCPSLLSSVWLQFATVVSENLAYGRCRECNKWFEVGANAARSSRLFCSTACRSKAYRERQDRARQMFAANKTFEEISEELDIDVATLRRWITGSKE